MEAQADFKELCELFNSHKVEYLIVGGHALAFHGAPRFTGDIDLLVRPTEANARRIIDALKAFGFEGTGLEVADFVTPGRIIQAGVPPVRVDIITSITGVSWEQADGGKVAGDYGGVPVSFIGRREFLANKAAAGRKKDLADIEALNRKNADGE